MNAALEAYIRNFATDQLQHGASWDERIRCAVESIHNLQENIYALLDKRNEIDITAVKVLTVLTLTILGKAAKGKPLAGLDTQDWKDIAETVSEYAVLPDGQTYTRFIFCLYEKYIRTSVEKIQGMIGPESAESIEKLADELKAKAEQLTKGEITEAKFVEDSLWTALDAMIKLLASTACLAGGKKAVEFANALASCAFEYGRLMLYRQEQVLVSRFLKEQDQLDAQLQQTYEEFKENLQAKSEQFYLLIDNAFAADFQSSFLQSILLAKAAGVEDEKVLTSQEEIDSFFLV